MTETKIDLELAQKAARWWANKLRGPVKLDNGDRSPVGVLTALMAGDLQRAERSKRSEQDIAAFESALTDVIIEHAEEVSTYHPLSVDYGPGYWLNMAASRAGIDLGSASLPWKTTMWIRDGKITVAEGYASPIVEVNEV